MNKDWSTIKKLIWLKATTLAGEAWKTVSGAVVSFVAVASPLKQLVVSITPVQNLHGYDYPWPAGGGKNKYDIEDENYIEQGGIASANGNNTTSDTRVRSHGFIRVEASSYWAISTNAYQVFVLEYDANQAYLSLSSGWKTAPFVINTSASTAYLRIVFANSDDSAIVPSDISWVQVEKVESSSSPSTSFAPYSNICPITNWAEANIHVSATQSGGTVYTVDWEDDAGAVFRGTLDVVTGVLTVTAVGRVFTGAVSESWTTMYSGTQNQLYRHVISGVKATSSSRACSHFQNILVSSNNTNQGYYGYTSGSNNNIWMQFRPDLSVYDTDDKWKAWLAAQYAAGTPLTCWVALREESYQTYQLTAQEVYTLVGRNYIWADTGDVTVKYRAR